MKSKNTGICFIILKGQMVYFTCNGTNFTDIPATPMECRNPGNCTDLPPPFPPATSGLSPTTSTVILEGDVATYQCANKWYMVDGSSSNFSTSCSGPNGTFPANISWPTCLNPIPPPPACVCLGDADMTSNASKILIDNFCRNSSMPGYLNPPSKKRCGTRDVDNPTVDNFCFCDSVLTTSSEIFI